MDPFQEIDTTIQYVNLISGGMIMLHESAAQSGKDPAFAYKRALGTKMFWAYSIFYIGFIVINLLKPVLMEATVFAGLNLAVVYGFALIILALILALIYNQACSKREAELSKTEGA